MTAREFAINAHGEQKYSEHPYVYHLDAVAEVMREFGFGACSFLMEAAYLHDVIEDCPVSAIDVHEAGFRHSWALVDAVTDGAGANRRQRKAAMYSKTAGWEYATIVKLADRIANVRECIKNADSKLSMYRCEHVEFRKRLWREDHNLAAPMWSEIDKLIAAQTHQSPYRLQPIGAF